MNRLFLVLSFGSLLAAPNAALAKAGVLDHKFGHKGVVTTSFLGADAAYAMALQKDGKFVVAGLAQADLNSGPSQFALARYKGSGKPDKSFGTGGKVTTSFPGGISGAQAVAVQKDGKIVAAGFDTQDRQTLAGLKFAAARYLSDGKPDPDFGGGTGQVTTAIPGGIGSARAIRIQDDNRILVGGDRNTSAGHDYVLVRYLENGSPDPEFGGGSGMVILPFTTMNGDPRTEAQLFAVALQDDGRIIGAGTAFNGPTAGQGAFSLARFLGTGAADPTFGVDGQVVTPFDVFGSAAFAVALLGNGRIVAGGKKGSSSASVFQLAGYTETGSLDGGFGTGGLVSTDFGGAGEIHALGVQGDGKIVAAGFVFTGFGRGVFATARYSSSGVLDPAWGSGGKSVTDFGSFSEAHALVIQKSGKILVAGFQQVGATQVIKIVRYKAK